MGFLSGLGKIFSGGGPWGALATSLLGGAFDKGQGPANQLFDTGRGYYDKIAGNAGTLSDAGGGYLGDARGNRGEERDAYQRAMNHYLDLSNGPSSSLATAEREQMRGNSAKNFAGARANVMADAARRGVPGSSFDTGETADLYNQEAGYNTQADNASYMNDEQRRQDAINQMYGLASDYTQRQLSNGQSLINDANHAYQVPGSEYANTLAPAAAQSTENYNNGVNQIIGGFVNNLGQKAGAQQATGIPGATPAAPVPSSNGPNALYPNGGAPRPTVNLGATGGGWKPLKPWTPPSAWGKQPGMSAGAGGY